MGGFKIDLVSVVDLDPGEVDRTIAGADVLLGDFTFERRVTAETIRGAIRLKLIQQPSVGVQHIDLEACRARGIPVANAAGANDKSVAEHTILLALMLMRKVLYFHSQTAQGRWTQMDAFSLGVFELAGKRWGIVGMGRIGRELARRLKSFDLEIFYTDPRRLPPEEESALGIQFAPLDKLIRRSDIVSLHAPLTDETRGMIRREILHQMKPQAILVNVARGELVDEEALAEALNTGKIAGAGIDVFSPEPIRPDSPILRCKNVVLTPHLAGTTNEARARIIEISVKNIVRVLKGEKPVNVVNGL